MKIAVLASGSKGNCTYIETKETKSLIDIGMTNLYVEKNLIALGIDPKTIENIFITHTHVDHIAGLKVFINKHHPRVYLTSKMLEELNYIDDYVLIDKDMNIKDLNIKTFKTSHDTDSVGYVFTSNNKALVYITDTGYINVKNHPLLLNKEAYIFESNHDIDLLMNNENYPYYLKQRILSDKGHLSNKDSAYYLSNFVGNKTKTIFLVHLSEQNNDPNIALETLKTNLKKKDIQINNIIIAKQMDKSELVEV